MNTDHNNSWNNIVKSESSLFDLKLMEIWKYRDLLFLLIRRDFIAFYKQTILGPIWFFLQPVFTTITFVYIFGNLANISTDAIPKPLFYLSGTIAWFFFSESIIKVSNVFKDNSHVFGKVYFPRMIMPISIIFSGLIKLLIQLILFMILLLYYKYKINFNSLSYSIMLFPILIIYVSFLALGFGMIVSSLTTKYRDLSLLLNFAIQLLMYATPVVYPLSTVSGKLKTILLLNPMTYLIEGFRKCTLGVGTFELNDFIILTFYSVSILFIGIIIFNKVEKNFIDTI